MRKAALGVALVGLAACGAPASGPASGTSSSDPVAPAATPSEQEVVYTFEGTVDPVTERMDIVYRTVTGEVVAEPQVSARIESPIAPDSCGGTSVELPYATQGSAGVYLHTKNVKWQSPILQGGVTPQNLYTNVVCSFTAVIDAITPTTVTVHSVTSGAPHLANWACSNGTGSAAGIPPCSLSYGAVAHTGTTSNDAQIAPWQFNSASGADFHFKGRVLGVKPSS